MIDWTVIRPGLESLVSNLTGLRASWEDGPREFIDIVTQAHALLSVPGTTPLNSQASYIYEDGPPKGWGASWGAQWGGASPDLIETAVEHEELTLRVKVESMTQDAGKDALHYVERLRGRMNFTSTGTALKALNLGYQRIDALQPLSATYDDRIRSDAFVDVRLSVVGTDTDTENPLARIERVIFYARR